VIFKEPFRVERVEESPLPRVLVFHLRNEEGDIEVQLDLVDKLFEDLGEEWERGDTLILRLETEESTQHDEKEIYAVGKMYHAEEEAGVKKYFFSIGGLQLIFKATRKIPELEELWRGANKKVYISVMRKRT